MAEGTETAAAETTEEDSVAFVAPAYRDMEAGWQICRDVMGGTPKVRATTEYYPKGDAETTTELAARIARTEVFPMFKETVKGLVGLVFRKAPALQNNVPKQIVELAEDIDGAGTHIVVFCRRVFQDAFVKGHAGIFVDVPVVNEPRALMRNQERARGIRPYWIHVKAEQIINWRTKVINGKVVLTLLVLLETVDEPSGRFGLTTTNKYRVCELQDDGRVTWEIWEQAADEQKPRRIDGGEFRGVQRIPFVPIYAGERIAPLQSVPPLIDLAYTNIAHVQVLSDRRTSLHAAGNPILVIKGRVGQASLDPNSPEAIAEQRGQSIDNPADGNETTYARNAAIPTGPNIGIEVDKEGDVKYAEHQGHALAASAEELRMIETRGAAQGLSMLQRNTQAAQTAETERLQRSEKDASLSTATWSMQDGTEVALGFTALFMGEGDGGEIQYDKSFEQISIDTPKIEAWAKALAMNAITRETFWKIVRSELPDDFDPVKEADALDQASQITLERMGIAGGTTPPAEEGAGGEPTPQSMAA